MKKIRIGNDIVIKWRVTINGEEVNLEGLDLSLYISTTYQPRRAIAFTVAGNEITATYKGAEQKVTGVYRLTLYRNEGENAQSILDACDAFELVSCSCLTVDAAFGGAEVELPIADLGVGIPGLSAYEIAVSEGFVGTQAEWIASLSAASEAAAAECREVIAEFSQAEDNRVTAETQRVVNENNRIAGEASRAEEENNRAAAEQLRVAAESKRDSAELARIANENNRTNAEDARSSAEAIRIANENTRLADEETRVQSEAARVTAESKRANAEAQRETAEADRRSAEQVRIGNETVRQTAEQDRKNAEANRVTAENLRKTAEDARIANEATRQTNEQARVTAETSRETAETDRADAEAARVEAETARVEEFATFTNTLAAKEDVANKVTSINADADDVHYPSAKAVKDSLAKVKNIEVTPEMLSESTKQFINASGGGTITNFADDEDLTTVDNALKLADKTYDPITYSGMGRKYLRKNFVDGKNILTQEMLPSANTIYIIQYDYDLNGATITIPDNCVLDFQGGSLGNGTIVGSNSDIASNPSTIFSNDLTISGSWRKNEWNIKWFGAYGDGINDDTAAINAATKIPYATLLFPAGQYLISSTIDGYETSQAWIGAECTQLSIYSASQTNEMASTIKCVGDNNGEPFVYCPKVLKNFGIFGERASITTPLYQNTIGMRMNKTKQFANQIIIDNLKVAYFGLGILHTTGFSNRINELKINRCYVGLDLSSEAFEGVDSGYITLLHISNYSIDNCITAAINRGQLGDTRSSICNVKFSHGAIESNGAPMITTNAEKAQGGSFIFNFLYSEETDEFCDVKGLGIRLINSYLRTNKIRLDYGILYMENTMAARATVEVTQYELLSFNSQIKELLLPTNRPGRTTDSQISGLIINNQDFNLYKLPVVSDLKQTRPFGFGSQNQSAGVLGFDLTNKVPVAWIDNTARWRGFDGYTPSAKGGDTRPTLASDDIGKQFFDTTLNKPIWWTGTAWVDATGATV